MACHQSFVCTSSDGAWPVTVIDLGFGGFKIRSESSVGERGELLHMRRVATDLTKKLGGSYTTGVVVRVAWTKSDESGWETGLYLPAAPGSMRIRWFRELLSELGLDETQVFSKRENRRHICRLPATFTTYDRSPTEGMLLDLSSGGGLLATREPMKLGESGSFSVLWGVRRLQVRVSVVGVRANTGPDPGLGWQHSVRFEEPIEESQARILAKWLEELAIDA